MSDVDEKEIFTYFINQGFTYKEIIEMLSEHHGIEISLRTLNRRLREWNLSRRLEQYDISVIKPEIVQLLDGLDSTSEYRSI